MPPCRGALRARWVAILALQPPKPAAASACCGRRPAGEFGPPPTRRRPRPRAPAANPARLARAAGGASAPPAPRAPRRQEKPSPARRGKSVAARRAPPVKAALAPLGAAAALTAPAPPLESGRRLAGKRAGAAGGPHRGRSRWSRRIARALSRWRRHLPARAAPAGFRPLQRQLSGARP
jgi:hypothetical protein